MFPVGNILPSFFLRTNWEERNVRWNERFEDRREKEGGMMKSVNRRPNCDRYGTFILQYVYSTISGLWINRLVCGNAKVLIVFQGSLIGFEMALLSRNEQWISVNRLHSCWYNIVGDGFREMSTPKVTRFSYYTVKRPAW